MFKPVFRSLALLNVKQKTFFGLLVGTRVMVHVLDVLGLVAVGVLGAMLASGLTDRTDAEFLGIVVPVESSQSYLWVTLIIAGFFIAKSAIGTVLLRWTTIFLARVEARAASEVARYLFSGDISRVRAMSKGDVQWAVSTSSKIAFSSMLFAGSALVTESALFLAVFAGFLLVDVSTAVIITVYFIVLIGLFQLSINQRLRRLGERLAQHSVAVNNSVLDMVSAFREATVLEKRQVFLNRFDLSRRRLAVDEGLSRFVMGLPRFFVEAALMIGIVALILWQFARGNLSEGLVVTGVFLAGGTRMMAAMLPLQNSITTLRIDGPKASRAHDLIETARASRNEGVLPEASSVDETKPITQSALPVALERVSFCYPGSEIAAVQDVSLRVEPGEFSALIGPSGAGKTTLADLILGIHHPLTGRVEIGGQNPRDVRLARPGNIGYVPQNPGMVSGTIAQNIALGVEKSQIDFERCWEVVELVSLKEFVDGLPEGLETSLGEQSDSLSGGQLQRLGLARALYARPSLLVLDEATSALDAETEAGVTDSIHQLRGQTTLIVIAHRLSTIQHADRVFVVEEGKLLSSGSFSEVRRDVPFIERYVQLMSIQDSSGT